MTLHSQSVHSGCVNYNMVRKHTKKKIIVNQIQSHKQHPTPFCFCHLARAYAMAQFYSGTKIELHVIL